MLFGDCPSPAGRRSAAALTPQDWRLTRDRFAGTLQTPSVAVIAREDRLLDSGALRRAALRIPEIEVVEIEGGHMPMTCRPRTLAARIVERVPDAVAGRHTPDQVNSG